MRRWKRPAFIAFIIGALASIPFFSRQFALRGLPDVGDPFDTSKFGHVDIADKDNAFVEYSTATRMLTRDGDMKAFEELTLVTKSDWSKGGTAIKTWLSINKPALDLWRQGTEKPDALYYQPESYTLLTLLRVTAALRQFSRLASAQGTKLESEGKMEEAFAWYRAILRSSRHTGRKGCMIERLVGISLHGVASERINHWSKDPRVDAKMLQKALDEVQAIDRMTPPFSDSIRSQYYCMMNTLQDPKELQMLLQQSNVSPSSASNAGGISGMADEIYRWGSSRFQESKVYSRNEPERSKRVLRLIFANVLAHCDEPASKRPPKVRQTVLHIKRSSMDSLDDLPLFETTAEDPPGARALPPQEIQKWFETTVYAKVFWPAIDNVEKAIDRERGVQSAMLLTLAEQLYRREHDGKGPNSSKDLIGPHLKTLPVEVAPTK